MYLLYELSLALVNFIYLNHSGSTRKVSQTDKLRAAGNPFTVKNRIVQTLLNMRNNLRLVQRR